MEGDQPNLSTCKFFSYTSQNNQNGAYIFCPLSISAGPEDHRRFRRLQAHIFSEKALASQEPLVQDYAQQFVDSLITFSSKASDRSIDLGRWYNFATFDLIGDLAFGEPFNCLKTGIMHSWITLIFSLFENLVMISELRKYPPIGHLLLLLIPQSIKNELLHHRQLSAEKAERRMATKTDRPDFMTYILKYNETEKGMTAEEIKANAGVLIIAGSETVHCYQIPRRSSID